MQKISWFVYAGIGILLVVASWIISLERLLLFFYAGFVFILIGIVKYIYGSSKEKKKNHSRAHVHKQLGQKHMGQKPMGQKPMGQKHIKYCQYCGTPSHLNAIYCRRCGRRV